jgi:hypothetical protein
MAQYDTFAEKKGGFNTGWEGWEYRDKPSTFWSYAMGIAPDIATIAIRLMAAISNSVASERSFLVMKLTQHRLRTRLLMDKVNMLQFIYMNVRAMEKVTAKSCGLDKLLEMEDLQLALMRTMPGFESHDPRMALDSILG